MDDPYELEYGLESEPTQVLGLSDIIDIQAGESHILALKKDGTVWAWGDNEYGQIGNGKKNTLKKIQSVPVKVKKMSNVVAISASYFRSAVLKKD